MALSSCPTGHIRRALGGCRRIGAWAGADPPAEQGAHRALHLPERHRREPPRAGESLSARLEQARLLGCALPEVPAEFIKDETEAELTGLNLGAFLDDAAVARLYSASDEGIAPGEYILHTEPSLPARNSHGSRLAVPPVLGGQEMGEPLRRDDPGHRQTCRLCALRRRDPSGGIHPTAFADIIFGAAPFATAWKRTLGSGRASG